MSEQTDRETAAIRAAGEQGTGGRLVASDGRTLPLRGVKLGADARGGLARVVLEQRFLNPYAEALRVSYLVPLPVDGVVAGYAFHIGGRRIAGEVDRIQAARERFETALLEGKSAALVEQDRPNLFTLEIGNVAPGAEVLAELTIDQRLAWLDEGAWEWRFPTVVAPRYLGSEGRVTDSDRVTVDVAEAGVAAGVSVTLVVRDMTPGGAPTSPSHRITVARAAGGLEVALAGETGSLDRDVVVRWPAAGNETGLALDTGRPAAGRPHATAAYGLLTVVPPAPEASAPVVPRDLILLIDTSGSMEGEPLEQAKAVARALVESLDDKDRLELIQFSNRPRRWRRGDEPATETTRRDAIVWLEALVAAGGTEMADGIMEALQPLRSDAQRQVVLITDGLIGFESEIVAKVARSLPAASRLHAVGVGSAPNRALTAPAARAGRGVEVVIGLGEEVKPHVARLLARMRAPVLTEIKLSGSALLAHAPAAVPDVYAGAPLRLALKLRPEGGDLRVSGWTPAGAWEGQLALPAVGAGQGSAAVVSLYGREAVEDMEVKRAAGAETVDGDIERIGLEFQIATRLTSWVAVTEEPAVDPTQPARRVRIPHALAHGLSVEGLGLRQRMLAKPAALMYPAVARLGLRGDLLELGATLEATVTRGGPSRLAHRLGFTGRRAPTAFEGRLVLRKDRELTLEIEVKAPFHWEPGKATVQWSDGTMVRAEIVKERTTAPGPVTPGLTVRLTLRLVADGSAAPPVEVVMATGHGPVMISVHRA
jgi:Ca-activated chloride channel homolog